MKEYKVKVLKVNLLTVDHSSMSIFFIEQFFMSKTDEPLNVVLKWRLRRRNIRTKGRPGNI